MHCMLSINDCLTVGAIQINVLEVWNNSVKLGIDDPNASPRYREEILFIRSENDDDDDVDSAFDPFEIEEFSPYAIPIL